MSHETAKVVADPSAYGFEFVSESVKSGDVEYQNVPLIRVTDLAKFDTAFPGAVLSALDGSSIRVSSQRIVREARDKNATIKPDEMKVKLVNWLNGVRAPSTRVLYAGPEGKTFATEAEAKQAWMDWASNL
jgi:hypothetical protein